MHKNIKKYFITGNVLLFGSFFGYAIHKVYKLKQLSSCDRFNLVFDIDETIVSTIV